MLVLLTVLLAGLAVNARPPRPEVSNYYTYFPSLPVAMRQAHQTVLILITITL